MKLELYKPIATWTVTQEFGANESYYQRFKDKFGNPLKGHNGIDLEAAHGTPIYSPCDGYAVYVLDSHGGEGIHLHTKDSFDYKDGQANFMIVLWHMCSKNDTAHPFGIPTDGIFHFITKGTLLGYSDNTGYPFESSGDHLHMGLYPENSTLTETFLEATNGENGAIDPIPYIVDKYAGDASSSFVHTFTDYLIYGMNNPEVRNLQHALNLDDPTLNLPETGYYGNLTRAAVYKFQQKHGIKSYLFGFTVGPLTRAPLNELFSKVA